MNNRSHLTRFSIVDKNGKATTVYRKNEGITRSLPAVTSPVVDDDFSDDEALYIVDKLMDRLIRPSNISWDSIKQDLTYIRDWEHPWTDGEKRNLLVIEDLCNVLEGSSNIDDIEDEALQIVSSLSPAVVPQMVGYSSSHPYADNWCARDKMLHELARDLIMRRKADALTYAPVDTMARNPRLFGLEDAQIMALGRYNNLEHNDDDTTYLGNVEPYMQESIARATRGDTRPSWLGDSESDRSLFPESERIFVSVAENDEGVIAQSQLYLALVFPVKELKEAMDRASIDNVSVSSFYNTREWGNVYTVMTPDGTTRSFSVYEHRNSDSIIINGLDGWDGNGLPYAGNSKNKHFGEFPPTERHRAAQSLTFYMMQAQQGELHDDNTLIRNAPHRDWIAILDEAIPAFKAWRQDKITDTYIAPDDENDEEILKRLDFS